MSAINSQAAQQLIEQATTKAETLGIAVSIAIVDAGAHLLAFRRMDGAFLGSVDVALNKARTSALFQLPSGDFGQLIRTEQLTGMELTNGMLAGFPGGVPLKQEDEHIGAIGISGGSAEQDLEVATFAMDKMSFSQ